MKFIKIQLKQLQYCVMIIAGVATCTTSPVSSPRAAVSGWTGSSSGRATSAAGGGAQSQPHSGSTAPSLPPPSPSPLLSSPVSMWLM